MGLDDHISFDMWQDFDPGFKEEPEAIHAKLHYETEKAILVESKALPEGKHWIPKSQVIKSYSDNIMIGEWGTIAITDWMYRKLRI